MECVSIFNKYINLFKSLTYVPIVNLFSVKCKYVMDWEENEKEGPGFQ